MISIISDIIELRLYVVFNGWYVMYDNLNSIVDFSLKYMIIVFQEDQ